MALSATERGGEILVYNSEGSLSADLTSPRGDGEFNLYNVHGNNSVWIRATEKSGEVTLRNPLGGFLAILGQESSGRGGLWIFDKYGLTNKFYGGPHLP
jgi:hypothetical protein